jgi:hypothetical protein
MARRLGRNGPIVKTTPKTPDAFSHTELWRATAVMANTAENQAIAAIPKLWR